MYCKHSCESRIILEVVTSYDLWILHLFFGLTSSYNDVNMLERSFNFIELIQGCAPPVNHSINGNEYTIGDYLANGIYPQWSIVVRTMWQPQENKEKYFVEHKNLQKRM